MLIIEREQRNTRPLPLTPLIDVVFLLMVFFILTTNYVEVEALKLGVLEDSVSDDLTAPVQRAHELVLLSDGAAFLNDKLVLFGNIEDRLAVILRGTEDTPVQLRADDGVPVQMLVDVLDMIKRTGGGEVKVSRWKETNRY